MNENTLIRLLASPNVDDVMVVMDLIEETEMDRYEFSRLCLLAEKEIQSRVYDWFCTWRA